MKIEQANPGDLDRLVAIENRAFDPAIYTRMTPRQLRRHIASDRAIFLVARAENGEAVGYALGFIKRNARYVRLYSLAVDPRHQGGRVGAELFPALEEAALRGGYRGVQLEIREDNAKLLERYLRLGYKQSQIVPDYYPDGAGCIKLKIDLGADPAAGTSQAS